MKYDDNTTIINNHIISNGESSYQKEINNLAGWWTENNLLFNISKTKELQVDFRKKEAKTQTPVYMGGAEVEQLNCFRFSASTLLRVYYGHHASPPQLKKTREKPLVA